MRIWRFREFVVNALVSGLLVLVPIYVAILLLSRVIDSLADFVRPVASLLPDWVPAGTILSLLLVLLVCFFVGLLVGTRIGHATRLGVEKQLQKLPGYTSIRSLTERLAGEKQDESWQPALAEIEEALVPAFIIEELEDGRFTVFVPSVPTPFAGSIYILDPNRVHPVNIPFTQAIKVVAQWGGGAKDLVAAMDKPRVTPERPSGVATITSPRPRPFSDISSHG